MTNTVMLFTSLGRGKAEGRLKERQARQVTPSGHVGTLGSRHAHDNHSFAFAYPDEHDTLLLYIVLDYI